MMLETGSLKRPRFRKHFHPAQGLALVEVLVAVMILSTSTIFVLQALSRAAVLEREINNLGRSQTFAASKMAEIEALARSGAELKEKQQGAFTNGEQSFNWKILVQPFTGGQQLRRITLDVMWKQGSEAYKRRLESLVAYPEAEEEL